MAKRSLREFGKRELIAEANRLMLSVKQSMSKAQLIDVIEKAQIEQQAKQPEPIASLAKVEPIEAPAKVALKVAPAKVAPKADPAKVAPKAAPKPIYRLLSNVMIGGAHISVGTMMNLSAEDASALLAQDAVELVK